MTTVPARKQIRPWILLLLMFTVQGLADEPLADEPLVDEPLADTSRWDCSLCPYPEGWFGTLEIGPGHVSDSSTRFGDYRGLDEKGLFLSLGGDTHYLDTSGRYFDLYARNLGIDSRQLELRGGQQGRYELRLSYTQVPKIRGHGTQTPYVGIGTGTLSLPTDWVRASQTGAMTSLNSALADTPLKTSRKTLIAGLTMKLPAKWTYRVDFEHQDKSGTRPFAGGLFLSNTTHFPAPVDFKTNQFDMALEYAGKRSSVRIGFIGSSFDNGTSSVTWENPFLSGPGTDAFRADLAPDNSFYQFNITGSFAPTSKIRLSGQAAIGKMKQDDPFLPYSINPQYSDLDLPRTSLNGKINTATLNLAGKLTARLSRKLNLTARLKLDERDNKTGIDQWTPVLTDLVPTPLRANRPYSFKRENYRVEVRWRAIRGLRLLGGVRQENIERTLQSVAETRERTYWGEALLTQWAMAQIRLKLESSERDASNYNQLFDGGPIENPLMRKFHLADRDRDRAIIEVDLSPTERLGISISYFSAEDDYSQSIVGLTNSEERSLSLDMNYAISRGISLYAFANRDEIDSEMASIAGSTGMPWMAENDDRITTLGIGLSGKINEKISIGFDWVSSDSEGRIRTNSDLNDAPFPILKSDLKNARINLSYMVNQHWAMKLYAEHEKYDSEDWAIDDQGPDAMVSVLTMGLMSPDYSITVLRLLARYTF